MRELPQQMHCDLGLTDGGDNTEDLRLMKIAPGRCANTSRGPSEHPPVTTTNKELH